MKETKYTCDHCGKELKVMDDYIDIELRDLFKIIETDLCSNCFNELGNIVLQYINKEQ